MKKQLLIIGILMANINEGHAQTCGCMCEPALAGPTWYNNADFPGTVPLSAGNCAAYCGDGFVNSYCPSGGSGAYGYCEYGLGGDCAGPNGNGTCVGSPYVCPSSALARPLHGSPRPTHGR